jgi:SAM-dependent methyltransferase
MSPSSSKHDYYQTQYPALWQRRSLTYLQSAGRVRYYEQFLHAIDGQAGERILDCGIGTGRPLALQLAQQGCQMHGIDLSAVLLAECARNCEQAGETIENVQGALEALPFPAEFFDKVYASSVIWRVDDAAAALREMHRVTREGGLLIFDVLNAWHVTPLASRIYHWALITFRRKPKALANLMLPPGMWHRWLKQLNLEVQSRGFFILLPTGLPVFGERMNLCRHSERLSFGWADSRLRYFGEKLLFICQKR